MSTFEAQELNLGSVCTGSVPAASGGGVGIDEKSSAWSILESENICKLSRFSLTLEIYSYILYTNTYIYI